jgi:hypothetical protein
VCKRNTFETKPTNTFTHPVLTYINQKRPSGINKTENIGGHASNPISPLASLPTMEERKMMIDEDQQWKLEYLTQEELDLLDTIKTHRYH